MLHSDISIADIVIDYCIKHTKASNRNAFNTTTANKKSIVLSIVFAAIVIALTCLTPCMTPLP